MEMRAFLMFFEFGNLVKLPGYFKLSSAVSGGIKIDKFKYWW